MSTLHSPLSDAGWAFGGDGGPGLAVAVSSFLDSRTSWPELLALGEPTHGEPAFPGLRNRILELLAERGFRSIAIESDCVAGVAVDAFVRGQAGTLDSAMAEGFSHGFGQLDGNRELVAWLRDHNKERPATEHVAFHGFDAPLEITAAPSPRPYLERLYGYLAEHLGAASLLHDRAELAHRLGADERWSDPTTMMDATRSVGASSDAIALRAIADDLMTVLHAQAPRLVSASSLATWHGAELHGRAALGVLRYHAQMAERAPQAERISRLGGIRDALMAENLLAIRDRERHRGPTLVFAHNSHLQRHPSTMRMADMDLQWFGAGTIVATLLGDRYAFVAGSLGASAELGLGAPGADTFEGAIQEAMGGSALLDASRLGADLAHQGRAPTTRTDVTAEHGYFPLDAAMLGGCDAILHVASSPAAPASAEHWERRVPGIRLYVLVARILELHDVTCVVADERLGAPEVAWGDRFFFVGSGRKQPFATIVKRDYPGWDEESRLNRPGVYRLNVELGREEFEREFGYPPASFAARRASIDFAQLDEILPHPVYATQGWACILNPGVRRLPDVDRLVAHAHRRAFGRRRR